MSGSGIIDKFELYIVSLWLLFFLIIFVTADIPVCFGDNCQFIGVMALLLKNIVPIISILLLIFGAIFYFRFNYKISGSSNLSVKISDIEDLSYEHLTFLTTYIIPLICFNLSSVRYVIVLGILLFVIGVIYVKTDKFYANPTLAILGYRLYKVTVITRKGQKSGIIVITRDRLSISDQIQMRHLDEKVSFARRG